MGIQVLPTHLVNKIAAGEVIERPSSVVKELVENALDAGATRVEITVEDGGRRLIQVTDDGGGMGAEDLALAFSPHATSKIASEDDLERIDTMGFRGEALASIASISHARIQTRRRADDGGHEIEASGETVGEVRPCAAAPGTTVSVRDLFFNTPARRKFMRTAATELANIVEQLARLGLPFPHVAFLLTHNGREVKSLPTAASTAQRVADLFDTELAEGLLPIVRRGGKVEVAGLLAPPAAARSAAKWQYFFLNGRYIRDRLLAHALREAFRGRIDPNRWPVGFVFLRVDPAEVDVNVHPTKLEVRFQNSQLVHGELMASLRETLNRADLTPAAGARPGQGDPSAQAGATAAGVGAGVAGQPAAAGQEPAWGPPGLDAAFGEPLGDQGATGASPGQQRREESLRQALADFFRSTPPTQPRLSFPENQVPHRPAGGVATDGEDASDSASAQAAAARGPLLEGVGTYVPAATLAEAAPALGESPQAAPRAAALAATALQIHSSYIVAATDDGLIIVDQHALHERILYNELRARLAAGRLAGQRLLIPVSIAVTAAEADTLDRAAPLLERLGIEVAPFGPAAVALQQFPALLSERGVEPVEFLRELLDRLAEDETTDDERVLEDLLAIMACKAAVKAGDPLTPQEIDSLLAQARDVEKASACPHGRPTTLRMTLKDLERQFRRT